ncbi:nucleotidyltransferase family protein [Methanosarcina hadiensis]|uniref:nucleotidyltransferase family protein n=1 Tax=Methanosarcina hadiensis TaxID=3078083 RepID=UPI00397786D7
MKLQNQREVETYISKLQEMLPELKKKYPIKYMGVFGSYVRGEQSPSSDLDILVEFNGSITLLDYARLENELSDKLEIQVDLVSKTALKPRIGKRVLSEVVEI